MKTLVGNEREDVVLVENSTRFQVLSLIRVLQSFGMRSMSFQGVVYPYWENIARGWEDILAVCLFLKGVLLIGPIVFVIGFIRYLWKQRTWNMSQVVVWIQGRVYEAGTRRVQKKKKKKDRET